MLEEVKATREPDTTNTYKLTAKFPYKLGIRPVTFYLDKDAFPEGAPELYVAVSNEPIVEEAE